MDELRHTFRPEFLNRVDDIVVFERLSRQDIDRIVDLQVEHFRKLLRRPGPRHRASARGAQPSWREKGYDPTYGARPLKRAIMTYLQNPLAKRLIAGEFLPGDTILVERAGEALAFRGKLKETATGTP